MSSTEIITSYLNSIKLTLATGDAREHAYRPAFQKLIKDLVPEVEVINEPAYTGGNAPDFLFKKGAVPIAYAECKDITVDIDSKEVKKQAERYVTAFGRILLTNYLEFQIIDESGNVVKISIAELIAGEIILKEEFFENFINIIQDYITPSSRAINSAKKLAQIMAGKARLLRDNALASLKENPNSDIYSQYNSFKEVLIKDLTKKDFADMYAQTLVYGLFVARYFDSTLPTFSRYEAQDLLPSSNPLLKKFFGHVAGTDYDPKIAWLVDSLIEAYLSADVHRLMHKEFKKKQRDPVLHFYETFLQEYDNNLRKKRGVYYTPQPIVSFIVRSVDQVLKAKFNLSKGLSDKSTIEYKTKVQAPDARVKDGIKRELTKIHKVQILDPAVGTGTFLNEVIKEIHKNFTGQEGLWPSYVAKHLLSRLHGFELIMASYTMAHLKLGVTLSELGYKGDERLSVWLTNSLDEGSHEISNFFMSQWLTEESNQASKVKEDLPIMVVMGNPPYSVSSSNKSESIQNLIKVYKKNLNEKKTNLDDDYIKFIRFAENQIEKNDSGIVAMITNNSFIDGVTHRQMRKHLMKTFDEIYILDLHGNAKKKETAPNGEKDENVFDIMQGVSINLFIKTSKSKKLARVYYAEFFGKQKEKYQALEENSFETIKWEKLETLEPYYFFVPKNFKSQMKYEKGFGVNEIFHNFNTGVQTKCDALSVQFSRRNLKEIIKNFDELSVDELKNKYSGIRSESSGWNYKDAKSTVIKKDFDYIKLHYRPFDIRESLYTKNSGGFIGRPRTRTMKHFFGKKNIGLVFARQFAAKKYMVIFLTNEIMEMCTQPFASYVISPLYLYHEDGTKTSNLDQKIWQKVNEITGNTEPEDILDYIYAILHSPSYREKYKEFLKINFPRVPYPSNKKIFWNLVGIGRELRALHLLEAEVLNDYITTYPEGGDNKVDKKYPIYEDGKVYINEEQYFGGVDETVWNFYIGGYQPAQKWLKDRRERELSTEDIEHYQKMIRSMSETEKLMKKIDIIYSS